MMYRVRCSMTAPTSPDDGMECDGIDNWRIVCANWTSTCEGVVEEPGINVPRHRYYWATTFPGTHGLKMSLYYGTGNGPSLSVWAHTATAPPVAIGDRTNVSIPLIQSGGMAGLHYRTSVTVEPPCVAVAVEPVSPNEPLAVSILGQSTCQYTATIRVIADLK